ncbi:MAG TPA: AAA family ATPase [Candidatus Limnocylindrales bacterium]
MPKLVVIRGNSGSGKSSIARAVRLNHGRGCALVEQDYLRRIILRELEASGGLTPEFIDHTVRYLLDRGQHVVLEGILGTQHYGAMLIDLVRENHGETSVFYLDVSFEETLRRHGSRPQATEFGAQEMLAWYRERDLLGVGGEHVIGEHSTLDASIEFVTVRSGLCGSLLDGVDQHDDQRGDRAKQ